MRGPICLIGKGGSGRIRNPGRGPRCGSGQRGFDHDATWRTGDDGTRGIADIFNDCGRMLFATPGGGRTTTCEACSRSPAGGVHSKGGRRPEGGGLLRLTAPGQDATIMLTGRGQNPRSTGPPHQAPGRPFSCAEQAARVMSPLEGRAARRAAVALAARRVLVVKSSPRSRGGSASPAAHAAAALAKPSVHGPPPELLSRLCHFSKGTSAARRHCAAPRAGHAARRRRP